MSESIDRTSRVLFINKEVRNFHLYGSGVTIFITGPTIMKFILYIKFMSNKRK